MTGQIGPRNGLMIAYQIEHDSTVDVARRLASRHLKIGQIDLSHPNSSASAPARIRIQGPERLLIRPPNYITNDHNSQGEWAMGNGEGGGGRGGWGRGEWAAASGEWGKDTTYDPPLPTPHSPLPLQLYLNHLASSGSVGRLPYISMPTR